MNEFLVSFDELLNNILVAYRNLDPSPVTDQGSVTYIKAACLASMLWGLYRYQDYLSRQIFPDTADTDNLNHHGYIYGITRLPTDDDTAYLNRILAFLRKPPAGGNKNDWSNWAFFDGNNNQITYTDPITLYKYYTDTATVYPVARGLGTVDIVTSLKKIDTTNTAAVPEDVLDSDPDIAVFLALVSANMELLRPVTSKDFLVLNPVTLYVNVDITIQGTNPATGVNFTTEELAVIQTDISSYIESLKPGDPVYLNKLSSICINDGVNNTIINTPTFDIIPSTTSPTYEVARAGSIVVHY